MLRLVAEQERLRPAGERGGVGVAGEVHGRAQVPYSPDDRWATGQPPLPLRRRAPGGALGCAGNPDVRTPHLDSSRGRGALRPRLRQHPRLHPSPGVAPHRAVAGAPRGAEQRPPRALRAGHPLRGAGPGGGGPATAAGTSGSGTWGLAQGPLHAPARPAWASTTSGPPGSATTATCARCTTGTSRGPGGPGRALRAGGADRPGPGVAGGAAGGRGRATLLSLRLLRAPARSVRAPPTRCRGLVRPSP